MAAYVIFHLVVGLVQILIVHRSFFCFFLFVLLFVRTYISIAMLSLYASVATVATVAADVIVHITSCNLNRTHARTYN